MKTQIRIGTYPDPIGTKAPVTREELLVYLDKQRMQGEWMKHEHLPLVEFYDSSNPGNSITFKTKDDIPSEDIVVNGVLLVKLT